ncbi:MAG: hypothetical protein SGI86_03505 [Deltaproteobacteria bacterium]|nr:hypothetical protein [Deltaproteobacteria bacterium]
MVWHEDDQPVSTFRIRVFGAMTSTEGLWTVLPNMAGEDSVEIAVGSNDPYEIAEFSPPARMTIPDRLTHAWDSRGFKYFLIGIERVYAVVGGGDASAAYLLAKIV